MSAENDARLPAMAITLSHASTIPSYLIALAVVTFALQPGAPVFTPNLILPERRDSATRTNGIATDGSLAVRWGVTTSVLPSSFPYGGRENRGLLCHAAFCRDKSLVSLIAHELDHSWSAI